jgi:hypothetical protein
VGILLKAIKHQHWLPMVCVLPLQAVQHWLLSLVVHNLLPAVELQWLLPVCVLQHQAVEHWCLLDVSGSSQTSGSGKCIVFMFPVSDEKPVHLLFSKFNKFPVDLSQFSTHFVSSQLHLTLPGFRFAPVFIDSSYLISFSLSSPLVLLLNLWMDISGFKRLIPVSLAFMSFPTWCNLYSKCLKIFC